MTPHTPPPAHAGAAAASDDTASATLRTHVVRKGDTLSTIAEQVYGQTARWTEIFAANRDVLDDRDCIHAGQVLQLPAD